MAEAVKPLGLVFTARSLYIFLDLHFTPTSQELIEARTVRVPHLPNVDILDLTCRRHEEGPSRALGPGA
jgi:hypothetical protein